MSDMSDTWQGRFAGAVAPSTGKIIKNENCYKEDGYKMVY